MVRFSTTLTNKGFQIGTIVNNLRNSENHTLTKEYLLTQFMRNHPVDDSKTSRIGASGKSVYEVAFNRTLGNLIKDGIVTYNKQTTEVNLVKTDSEIQIYMDSFKRKKAL